MNLDARSRSNKSYKIIWRIEKNIRFVNKDWNTKGNFDWNEENWTFGTRMKVFEDTIVIGVIISQFNVVRRPICVGRKCFSGTHHFHSSLLFLYRRPLCTPPAVLLVDTSAECLSRLSDTSTSVESIVHFGVRLAMLIDKCGRTPGRTRSKEQKRRRRRRWEALGYQRVLACIARNSQCT